MSLGDEGIPPLAFVQLLEQRALDSDAASRLRAIMRREGTDEATLIRHDIQVPIRWFREVYPELDIDQAIVFGIAFAEEAQLTSFGPLSAPLISAGSVAEIVELLTYLPLISTALRSQFNSSGNGLSVGLTANTGDPALDCLVVTYGGCALLRLLDMLAGDMSSVKLHLSWPAPTVMAGHPSVSAERLSFDAPVSFVEVPEDTLTMACRFSDPLSYRLAIADLQRTFAERTGTASFSERVRQILQKDPGQPSHHWIARQMAISTSTLKRHLAAEGTTYRGLQQSMLHERAVLLLLDRTMSVSEVAAELGYSDAANFSHAFKRWTGRSPREFRNPYHY
ncbi:MULTISPECIES: AraC family transcriptional regulator [unclassified Rhodococcus (in: high G+C Gram-positive bacteria)]|jgi:AraC-like DNA-binding protein|uniref:AraC family transcriptional regulator n=1 Tax=unclassified Rhodococcus (in: high G+C Gram-positive bacteria) TaxID=192944 RepID=UPI001C9B7A61|nr:MULTISPECIES: AraC family transcriptional regulator [unclassified Rhodococcus (in: high G+C Gram-positive bacteria)]MBY6709107.1 helix-turn-helix domain-containing protein [Rhodococcus sp. BP-241]